MGKVQHLLKTIIRTIIYLLTFACHLVNTRANFRSRSCITSQTVQISDEVMMQLLFQGMVFNVTFNNISAL